MKRANLILLFALSAVLGLSVSACTDPDPGGEFDRYSEMVGEGDGADGNYVCNAQPVDLSGFYLARLQHSVNPFTHLLLSFDIESTATDTYTLVVQPLLTDINQAKEPREDAREPVGDAFIVEDIQPNSEGTFDIAIDDLRIDGQANASTWGDILADIELELSACADDEGGGPDRLCGTGNLDLKAPIPVEATATFGAVKVDEIDTDTLAPKSCTADPE